MKMGRIDSVSDRTLSRLLRWGGAGLVLAVLAFGVFYYFDQRIDTGPSNLDRQVSAAEAAVVKAPSDISLRLTLAAAYQMNERLDDSLKQYDEVLRVEGDHRAALLGQGRVLYAKGELDRAIVPLTKITESSAGGEFAGADTQLQEASYLLGSIALRQGKTDEAVTHLTLALRIEPTDSDALFLVGQALTEQGHPADGVASLRQALVFVPVGWCEPYAELARAYGDLKDEGGRQYAAAMTDFCKGRAAEAKTQLTALAAGPQPVDAMVGLALIAETESQREQAADWYRKALALDAANITATTGLARVADGATVDAHAAPATPAAEAERTN